MAAVPSSDSKVEFAIRIVAVKQVSAADIESWAALEARAIEPNAYLSPYFVLPATRYLTPQSETLALFVEPIGPAPREMVGVGVFDKARPSRHFPVPRLIGYRSRHTYLGGLLLDRDCHAQALRAMLRHLRSATPWFQGLEFVDTWTDGPLAQDASDAGHSGAFEPVCRGAMPRAVLRPANCPALLLDKALASRLRDLNRRKRRLEERGRVGWRWYRDDAIAASVVEGFLALEHMGWKGQGGSSLRSKPGDEAFFRELVQGFASQRRALFTVLTLDDEPIASCCTFISGRVGFGFKIGWNPDFKAFAPAKLNEIELMRHALQAFSEIDFFDSGAESDSYINELWLERKHLGSLSVPTRPLGACALRLAEYARRARELLRNVGASAPAAIAPAVESGIAT